MVGTVYKNALHATPMAHLQCICCHLLPRVMTHGVLHANELSREQVSKPMLNKRVARCSNCWQATNAAAHQGLAGAWSIGMVLPNAAKPNAGAHLRVSKPEISQPGNSVSGAERAWRCPACVDCAALHTHRQRGPAISPDRGRLASACAATVAFSILSLLAQCFLRSTHQQVHDADACSYDLLRLAASSSVVDCLSWWTIVWN